MVSVNNSTPPPDHPLAKWAAPIAVAISITGVAVSFVSHYATDDARLAQIEVSLKSTNDRQGKDEADSSSTAQKVSALEQQARDTNQTVHEIMRKLLHQRD